VKKFAYRGNANEEWSNTYMLTGSTPADSAAWRTLFDALVAQEKTVYSSYVTVIGGYGYSSVDDDATAIWSVDLTVSPNTPVSGTYTSTSNQRNAGDTAAWVRWGLDRFNSKGKRIYLRKYFHNVYGASPAAADTLEAGQVTALTAFGAKMDDGSFAGGRKITDKLGTATVGHAVSPNITTRTLKRRGKRPPTG